VTEKIGFPELPVIRRLFEVPFGARVEFEILDVEEENFNLDILGLPHIKPRLPSVLKVKDAEQKFVINEDIYNSDIFYPDRVIDIKYAGIIRGHQLFQIVFYPVKYNSLKNKMIISKRIKIKITFKGGDISKTINSYLTRDCLPFYNLLKDRILNYGVFYPPMPDLPIGLLIITPDEWYNHLKKLKEWKKTKGYHTKIVKLSEIGNDTFSIRNYIISLYNTWDKNLTFVVLIGDVDKIPYFKSKEDDNPENDLKYSLVDGTDYFPDLYVGRISVKDTVELKNVIQKILNYEKVLWSQGEDWSQKAFFIASADPSWHEVAEGTHVYCMNIVRQYDMIADSIFAYYQSGAPQIITDALNEGRSLCTYSGHGTETGWSDYGDLNYYNSDIYNNLINKDKYTFIQTYACLTGAYADINECFMEAWIRAPEKGAVVSFGSSTYSYWDEDDILQKRIFDELFDSNYVWIMGAINEGKIELYNHYGNIPMIHRYFQMYNLFGDPSLIVFTNIPQELTVSHPSVVPMGYVQIDVNVENNSGAVKNALVSIVQNDSIIASEYTDISGNAVLNFEVTSVDTVFITVTAYNNRPYLGYIMVTSEGPYVSYYRSEIIDSIGNNNKRVNPGEEIDLNIWVKNWGNSTAYGVSAILRKLDTLYTTVLDSTDYFGDILPSDSVQGQNNFKFLLSNFVPHNYNIDFSLILFSSQGDTWRSNFNLKVYSTDIEYVKYVLVDEGNNGILEPGEQGEIIVYITNNGGESGENVTVKLKTYNQYITVIDSVKNLGLILPGDTITNINNPFVIKSDSNTPPGTLAEMELIFSSQYEIDSSYFYITIGKKSYFVWDPDPNHTSGPVIHQILSDLGYSGDYSYYISDFDPSKYISLFVCLGVYSDNYKIEENSTEAEIIEEFAADGGRIYMEGGDVWFWDPMYGGHNFNSLFGLDALQDGEGDLSPLNGLDSTFTEGMNFNSYTGENNYIDHIQANTINSFNIFKDLDNNYFCAVANAPGDYKTVAFSFELAGLVDLEPPSTRAVLLDSIMKFFGIQKVEIRERILSEFRKTKIINLNTLSKDGLVILFEVASKEKVWIDIFDVTGRKVLGVLQGKILFPGRYKSYINIRKNGIYFIKMRTDSYQKIIKKIVID
jgi:hypothetical protein